MMRMYYSIVHTHHIHCSDMYIHVYARWVGFQMVCTQYVLVRTVSEPVRTKYPVPVMHATIPDVLRLVQ
jgi:hypothetical protein